jgi:hypothetical protein
MFLKFYLILSGLLFCNELAVFEVLNNKYFFYENFEFLGENYHWLHVNFFKKTLGTLFVHMYMNVQQRSLTLYHVNTRFVKQVKLSAGWPDESVNK